MRSLKRYLKAIWDLLRLEHGLMYGFGVVIGIYVSDPFFSDLWKLLLGYLTAVFLQASTFALNDYFDYEVDLVNNRTDRPLVRGDLSRRIALALAIALMPPGFVAAYLISPLAFIFAFAVSVLACLYDYKLKELGFAGNVYIAFTMAAPFLFGSIISSGWITEKTALLASMAFLTGVGREIMKGIEDVEGDALRDVRSLARTMGERKAASIASLFYLTAVSISPIPLFLLPEFLFDLKYAVPVSVTDVLLIYVALRLVGDYERESIRKYRKVTLVAMVLGLVGFFAGAF
ncbi:UbiA family prenyltransferase [Archaeoglobus fulgidus]|nr:UbiA family prenyltransferase [Archaeoglobus fulgidus]AIG97223.1 4-hydroxybenzoate polyprenyltransferase [Archaeoglobus fulgidus DSM 8774]KUJ94379.1 MAG: 4-hydroxybenzoate octaprenyltransferase, putative [Archaeoglobus fulgidus]KUK06536.1 MAG: 4-hydroxybenzoate octaprenyltransferase, putative [Archaeoglobus fulgidus]